MFLGTHSMTHTRTVCVIRIVFPCHVWSYAILSARSSFASLDFSRARAHGGMAHLRRWGLVALSCVEILTATGIMFGWSSIALALRRDGVYSELCADDDSGLIKEIDGENGTLCKAQTLRYNACYTAGAVCVPLSMFLWGPLLDSRGAKLTRLLSLGMFAAGALLFAFSDSKDFDAYIPASAIISCGGAGFFFSHFVVAEHFPDHFGLIHSLVNCSFDASTVTFTVLELLHRAGATTRALFIGLAGVAGLYAALTHEIVWSGYLSPPQHQPRHEQQLPDSDDDKQTQIDQHVNLDSFDAPESSAKMETAGGAAEPAPEVSRNFWGDGMDATKLPLVAQFKSPHCAAILIWAIFTVYRTMFALGSIAEQMATNAGGRSSDDAESLVRLFNILILVSVILTPAFGAFVDRCGMAAGFTVVNVLGIFTFGALIARPSWVLSLAFLAFGCFRAWNYSCMSLYVQGVFGGESFGRIYGWGIGVCSLTVASLQYPSMHIAVRLLGSEPFVPFDVALVIIGAALFGRDVQPALIGRKGLTTIP